jgi:hypothetical protein
MQETVPVYLGAASAGLTLRQSSTNLSAASAQVGGHCYQVPSRLSQPVQWKKYSAFTFSRDKTSDPAVFCIDENRIF